MRCHVGFVACVITVFIKVVTSNLTTTTLPTTEKNITVKKLVLRKRHEIPKNYTYIVLLHRLIILNNKVRVKLCSGSIIGRDWVLTAAHCLVTVPPQKVMYKNIPFPFNPEYEFNVRKTYPYPKYRTNIYGQSRHDIGIVRTDMMPMDTLGRISAIDGMTLTGVSIMFAGIQYIEYGKPGQKIGYFDVKTFNGIVATCNLQRVHWQPEICVVNQCDKKFFDEATKKSTGGPLLYRGKIVGVVNGLELASVISFTPVNPYLDWIRMIISQR